LDSVLGKIAAVGRWLYREFVAAWPVFLFFMIGFMLLLSIIKLTLATFSIEVTAFSKALVGALFAAKAVLILDEMPIARYLEQYRRILAVTVKTLIYGCITLLLGFLERTLEALHQEHTLRAAGLYVLDHASMYRLFAWSLGISLVFAHYFALSEIKQSMGEGALWRLFFELPKPGDSSSRESKIAVGERRS
jgi:hypothetical protein